jgi:mono/diheme cytochrome c family protein
MPIWHEIVSKRQISDLVSYIHAGLPAVEGATPPTVPANQGQAPAQLDALVAYLATLQ